jgi:hypothetical protein
LRATPLDISKGTTSGEPQIVAHQVGFLPATYWGAFAAAENGTVVYNATAGASLSVLTWFDRSGRELGHTGDAGCSQIQRFHRTIAERRWISPT